MWYTWWWLIKAETYCKGACAINTRGIWLRMRYCYFIVFYSWYMRKRMHSPTIKLVLYLRPNKVGASFPSLEDGKRSGFRNVEFSGYLEPRTMEQNPGTRWFWYYETANVIWRMIQKSLLWLYQHFWRAMKRHLVPGIVLAETNI
jgi:hypothetical protein